MSTTFTDKGRRLCSKDSKVWQSKLLLAGSGWSPGLRDQVGKAHKPPKIDVYASKRGLLQAGGPASWLELKELSVRVLRVQRCTRLVVSEGGSPRQGMCDNTTQEIKDRKNENL